MSSNFSFLAGYSPLLADLGATAERLFPYDPASSVLKLRLLAEALTLEMANRVGVHLQQPTQAELFRAVDSRLNLDPQIRQMFHLLRQRGNAAAHQVQHDIGYPEGMEALKIARELAVWFHRSFGSQPDFKPGAFILPDNPSQKLATLQQQIAQLNRDLQQAQISQSAQAELARLLEAQADQEREMARRAQEEKEIFEALATEASERYALLKAEFDNKHATGTTTSTADEASNAASLKAFSERAADAAKKVVMNEAATRLVIDQMLTDAGWEADTVHQTHAKGARPERNKNKAISEWPTLGQQSADYLLFAGLTPVAAVEAKRINTNVAGKIPQAERYARGFQLKEEHATPSR
ncbi:DUF4145 domain-containing protein [Rhodoferax sp. BLA1]|uniref:DUF4145 domain-containing protein n=1 Tax=Rhodoferax sp. BLA1 TaxID=2576062 RepID=UPI0015D39F77|nr:DUF4145 domain-containing protein [Rhodoferax sp. BLA1]